MKLPNGTLAMLAFPLATQLAGCDEVWPSAAVEGTRDSMTIHIVNCSDEGIVELVVAERDSQELWRIQSEEPVPAWEIEYGVAPAGFEVLQQPWPLAGVDLILIDTVRITGRGNELPLQDRFVLERIRVDEVYVSVEKYVAPSNSRNGLMTTSVQSSGGHGCHRCEERIAGSYDDAGRLNP